VIEILKPGIQSSLQDTHPRPGLEHGVPQGGAADTHAAQLANIILGQDPHLPVLEIPSSPFTIRFHHPARISLTGGGMEWHISTATDTSPFVDLTDSNTDTSPSDHLPISDAIRTLHLNTWRSPYIPAGTTLTGRPSRPGFRSYLGIASGFSGQSWLGSYSTELRLGAGGSQRALRKGDVLYPKTPFSSKKHPETSKMVTKWQISRDFTSYLEQDTVRIFPGPESDWFSEDTLYQLTAHSWILSRDSNRMGIRLQSNSGTSLKSPDKNLISTVVLPGTIQLTPSGPILLGPDAQTSGGYPRIAQVCLVDQRILAQKSPGESIRFQWMTLAEAIRIEQLNTEELKRRQQAISYQ
jgi:allophanate hydrolase subunit 2